MAVVEEVKESAESSSQRRRGARKMAVVEEVKESAEPVAPVEDPASPVLKTSAQPKRGAKKGKGKVVERVAASEIPLPSSEPCGTCKKTKRGITWDNEVEGGDSEEDTPVPVEAVQLGDPSKVKEPSTKKGGRRKLTLVEEEEEEVKSPVKRGRGRAAVSENTEVEEEVKKSPVRRGRKAALAKSPEKTKETSVAAESKQAKKVSPKQAVVDEASSATVSASPARRGRKAKAADLEVTALAKEEKKKEAPVPRKGRAASKAATEKIANNVKELSNLGAKKRRPDDDEEAAKKDAPPPAKRANNVKELPTTS